jgi:hypothetical protein
MQVLDVAQNGNTQGHLHTPSLHGDDPDRRGTET